jgi:hypothetical protein
MSTVAMQLIFLTFGDDLPKIAIIFPSHFFNVADMKIFFDDVKSISAQLIYDLRFLKVKILSFGEIPF